MSITYIGNTHTGRFAVDEELVYDIVSFPFGVILGSFWGHFGIILGSFWVHFGLGSFWGHFVVIFENHLILGVLFAQNRAHPRYCSH